MTMAEGMLRFVMTDRLGMIAAEIKAAAAADAEQARQHSQCCSPSILHWVEIHSSLSHRSSILAMPRELSTESRLTPPPLLDFLTTFPPIFSQRSCRRRMISLCHSSSRHPCRLRLGRGVWEEDSDKTGPASRQGPPRRPDVKRRDVPMPDILLMDRVQRSLLRGKACSMRRGVSVMRGP